MALLGFTTLIAEDASVDHEITRILTAIEGGDAKASSELLPLVYQELRRVAAGRLASEKPGQTLQATALVHEAYVRLVGNDERRWNGRSHFLAAASEAMRRILIERARAKKRQKRGGGGKRFDLTTADLTIDVVPDEILDLDEALNKLAEEDPVKAELVKLRFFGGMSLPEAAAFLRISTSTADRYWAYARVYLYTELRDTTVSEHP
ncbi:MAG: sigma-70 family RNA polymerase sigma factor [Planctomycetota bacterium]